MGINFNNRVLVTNPTTYGLGLCVMGMGIMAIIVGIITYFTGDLLIPGLGWCALGTPTLVIGGILRVNGLTRNGG